MMKVTPSLPNDYSALDSLEVCANILLEGGVLFEINNLYPIIIGNGIVPAIWLKGFFNGTFVDLIENNKVANNIVSLSKDVNTRTTSVTFAGITIFKASMINDGSCKVLYMDMRPLGLSIYTSDNVLFVGNAEMTNNRFRNVRVMVGLGNI